MAAPKAPRRLLTLAIQKFDRTAALHNGLVTVPDVFITYVPAAVSVSGLMAGVFDAAEMPLARYVFLRDRGEPYVAIPVFPDRLFIQQYVYTRLDTGIRSTADLRGRRVLVPNYYMTASMWHRAMLEEDHGILPPEISWHTTSPEPDPRMTFPDGVNVVLSRGPHLGAERLLDGTVDCLMTEGTPAPEDERFVRVHREVGALQREYYRETGVHAIVHVIAVSRRAADERPEILEELCQAFDRAKEIAYRALQNERMTSLPLMRGYLDETVALFGQDPWPYGLERNWRELDLFLGHAHKQGLTGRRLTPEDLFASPSREFAFSAQLPRAAGPGPTFLP